MKPVKLPKSKRIFDIIISILIILVFTPFIVLVIIFFCLEYLFIASSRGNLLYSETRISMGKPFKLFKFRVIKNTSTKKYFSEHGFIQTKELEGNPNNLTILGKILKQIYMDELPQLYNVLKGDMTLVGPRPSNEVVTWQDGQIGKFQRYLFKCGLSGPFQIEKDATKKPDQTQVDIEYILYCKNNNGFKIIIKDLYILIKTISFVIRAKGI